MEFSFLDYDPHVYLAIAFGLYMAWGIGANDFSNSVGPAVGAKVLSIREAVVIAIVFEMLGAILFGAQVTDTLSNNIIDISIGDTQPILLAEGMLAALLAAALWLTVASAQGWPVSTTHSVIGAMVGFALAGMGVGSVYWSEIGRVLVSWLTSPLFGGLLAYLMMKSILGLILNSRNPANSARRWVHLYVFSAAFVVCLATFYNGLLYLGIELNDQQSMLLAGVFALGITIIGVLVVRGTDRTDVEHAFVPITLFTVCSMAFAHGSNDVANIVGPMHLVMGLLQLGDMPIQTVGLSLWIFLFGGVGIALGMATFGSRVVRTVGHDITALTPSSAFTVTLASTGTVVLASSIGMPVSTTHTVIGAVLGVGLASGAGAVHYPVIKRIALSWLITLPVTALLAAAFFFMLGAILGT